jgi:CHAT domain-containing protein
VQQLATGHEQAQKAISRLALLWQVLVPEAQQKQLTSGKLERLIDFPDGPLALLPLEALVVEAPQDSEPTYLIDIGPPVVYGPSATALVNLAGRDSAGGAATTAEPVLTVGDPAYPAHSTTPTSPQEAPDPIAGLASRRREGATRMNLNRLPYSGVESGWVAELFTKHGMPAMRLTGAQATEANLRARVGGRRIVHLACHGMSDDAYAPPSDSTRELNPKRFSHRHWY